MLGYFKGIFHCFKLFQLTLFIAIYGYLKLFEANYWLLLAIKGYFTLNYYWIF
jgi:hypothetical protein